MRYHINFDKTVNQLVPHYIGGRKLILFIQAILYPLQTLNDAFSQWARDKRIEASMTSQVIKFEWFLNYKFSKYFTNPQDRITIMSAVRFGTELNWEDTAASGVQHQVVRFENESEDVEDNMILYHSDENDAAGNKSFIVSSPAIDMTKISEDEYLDMLTFQIDKYKISGKTYSIELNETV